jgi:hypothetical protein
MQKAKQFLVGCLGLLFICGAIYVFTDCGGPSTTVARPTATEPYQRAVTRIPTSAPVQAVGTTAVAPLPEIPLDVQLYLLEARPIIGDGRDGLVAVSTMLRQPDFGNDAWVINLAAQMALLKGLHARALALDPVPADMAQVNLTILRATAKLSDAMDNLAQGIDEGDVAAVERAAVLTRDSGIDMDYGSELLTAYLATHQAP